MTREIFLANRDATLSQTDFIARRNNFNLFFVGRPGEHYMGDIWRKRSAFVLCSSHEPGFVDLANQLYGRELRYPDANTEALLYRAYLMLRKHASKDWEIFQ